MKERATIFFLFLGLHNLFKYTNAQSGPSKFLQDVKSSNPVDLVILMDR